MKAMCYRCGREVELQPLEVKLTPREIKNGIIHHSYICPYCKSKFAFHPEYSKPKEKEKSKSPKNQQLNGNLEIPEGLSPSEKLNIQKEEDKKSKKRKKKKSKKKPTISDEIIAELKERGLYYPHENSVTLYFSKIGQSNKKPIKKTSRKKIESSPGFYNFNFKEENYRINEEVKGYLAHTYLTITLRENSSSEISTYTIYKNLVSLIPRPKTLGIPLTFENPFSQELINAFRRHREEVEYEDNKYQILYGRLYETSKAWCDKSFAIFSEEAKVPIYVTKQPMCEKCFHNTEEVIAYVKDKNTNRYVGLNAAYCYTCDKYYVLNTVLKELHLQGSIPKYIFSSEDTGDQSRVNNYELESILAANGYTVAKNSGLSDFQRQQILENIIDMGIMTRNEIIYHLEGLIELRKLQRYKDFSEAIDKWKSDIRYVINYHTPDQREVVGEIQE